MRYNWPLMLKHPVFYWRIWRLTKRMRKERAA